MKTAKKQLNLIIKRIILKKNKIIVDSLRNNHKEFIKNNKIKLKTQQSFKSERHNAFAEETNKIPLSSNDDKRMQHNDLIETFAYGTSKI